MRDDRDHYDSLDRQYFRKNEYKRYSPLYRPFRNDDINHNKKHICSFGIKSLS